MEVRDVLYGGIVLPLNGFYIGMQHEWSLRIYFKTSCMNYGYHIAQSTHVHLILVDIQLNYADMQLNYITNWYVSFLFLIKTTTTSKSCMVTKIRLLVNINTADLSIFVDYQFSLILLLSWSTKFNVYSSSISTNIVYC